MSDTPSLQDLNPFPGLRPFDTSEADRFFGRQQQVDELAVRISQVPFLAVTGDSGCGKSSLVRAGLLHRLRDLHGDGTSQWRCAVMSACPQPTAALARALVPALEGALADDPDAEARLLGWLRLGGRGLIDAIRLSRPGPQQRLLVVVDQFEEIFREELDPDESQAFVKLLLNVAFDRDSPVSVMITLRSDELGSCADFRGLPEAISRGQYLVPRLTRAQRTEVITGPVSLRGKQVSPRLVQRLLNDVTDAYDDLPVLQHALTRTWNKWAGATGGASPIDIVHYEQAGSTARALSEHGKEACGDLPGLEATVAKVFRALTERVTERSSLQRGPEGRERRRPLPFDTLCEVVAGPREEVAKVVQRFRRRDTCFLMDGPALDSNPIINISHESLIRLWDRLRDWVAAESESEQRLRNIVYQEEQNAKGEGSLLRGAALADALEWHATQQPNGAWAGLYLGAQVGAQRCEAVQRYLERSSAAQRRSERRERNRRWLITGLAGTIFVTALVIGAAGFMLAGATKARILTSYAYGELNRNPAKAAHLAMAAVRFDASNSGAVIALRSALATLQASHVDQALPGIPAIADLALSPDRSRLLAVRANSVQVLDAQTLNEIGAPMHRSGTIRRAWMSADNGSVVTLTADGEAQHQRLDGTEARPLICPRGGVTKTMAIFGSRVAGDCSGAVWVWQLDSPNTPTLAYEPRQARPEIAALAFAADGASLAIGDASGQIEVRQLVTPAQKGAPDIWQEVDAPNAARSGSARRTHGGKKVLALAFDPDDDRRLLSAGADRNAIMWRLDKGDAKRPEGHKDGASGQPLAHAREIEAVRYLPARGDRHLFATLSGKTVQIWDGDHPERVLKHDDWVSDIDFAANDSLIVTASHDGIVRVWSMRTALPVAILRGHRDVVLRAIFTSADGSSLVTLGLDGQALRWRLDIPQLLRASPARILGAAYSPDGTRAAILEEQGSAILELDGRHDIDEHPRQTSLQVDSKGTLSRPSWSRDGRFLAASVTTEDVSTLAGATVFDAVSGAERRPKWLVGWRQAVFSSAGDEILTIDDNGVLALWPSSALDHDDAESLAVSGTSDPRRGAIALSPDGRWIAVTNERTIELWPRDGLSGHAQIIHAHKGAIRSLTFSPDSRWLLSSSNDRSAKAWPMNPATDKIVELGGGSGTLMTAAFDSTGRRIATGSADGQVDIWSFDPKKHRVVKLVSLRAHSETVNTAQFAKDGKTILSSSDDGTVRLSRCELCTLEVAQLPAVVSKLAVLSGDEAVTTEAQSRLTMRDFGWGTLWNWRR